MGSHPFRLTMDGKQFRFEAALQTFDHAAGQQILEPYAYTVVDHLSYLEKFGKQGGKLGVVYVDVVPTTKMPNLGQSFNLFPDITDPVAIQLLAGADIEALAGFETKSAVRAGDIFIVERDNFDEEKGLLSQLYRAELTLKYFINASRMQIDKVEAWSNGSESPNWVFLNIPEEKKVVLTLPQDRSHRSKEYIIQSRQVVPEIDLTPLQKGVVINDYRAYNDVPSYANRIKSNHFVPETYRYTGKLKAIADLKKTQIKLTNVKSENTMDSKLIAGGLGIVALSFGLLILKRKS